MDTQSPLLQPSSDHTESIPILIQLFIYKGLNTNVCLFTDCLTMQNIQFTQMIRFTCSFKFDIVVIDEQTFLKIEKGNVCLELKKQGVCNDLIQNWQRELMKVMNRKNFHEFFIPSKKIGAGNFASVYHAIRIRDQLQVAVKAFKKHQAFKNPKGEEALFNEITILRSVKSPNIVQLYGVYQTEKSIYMVQEYAHGKHLAHYLAKFGSVPLSHRKQILRGLLNGLSQIHSHNIIHRDIKPQNIIYSGNGQESVKIVDFGLATFTNQNSYIFVRCGTPGYVAPEIIEMHDNSHVRLNTISDLFSAGAIYYQVIFNKPLFDGNSHIQILEKNRRCDLESVLTYQMKISISKEECDILSRMLSIDPSKRITAAQGLNHPFLTNQNIFGSKNSISSNQKIGSNTLSKISMYHSRKAASLKDSLKN